MWRERVRGVEGDGEECGGKGMEGEGCEGCGNEEEGEGCVAYLAFVLQMSRDGCCSSSREARGK